MTTAQNCWEFKNCGRQPGGSNVAKLGVCPAATDTASNGLKGGKKGGGICWSFTGTLCGGVVQGSFAQKQVSCLTCEFMKTVKQREGAARFVMLKPGQKYQAHT